MSDRFPLGYLFLLEASLVEIKVILVTWEHLLDNFMQSIYPGFLRLSYTTGHSMRLK